MGHITVTVCIIIIMQIGNLEDHYHFQLDINVTLTHSEGQQSANSKSLDHFSDNINFGLRGEITRVLSNSPEVIPDPCMGGGGGSRGPGGLGKWS